jgi:hypothetical protein
VAPLQPGAVTTVNIGDSAKGSSPLLDKDSRHGAESKEDACPLIEGGRASSNSSSVDQKSDLEMTRVKSREEAESEAMEDEGIEGVIKAIGFASNPEILAEYRSLRVGSIDTDALVGENNKAVNEIIAQRKLEMRASWIDFYQFLLESIKITDDSTFSGKLWIFWLTKVRLPLRKLGTHRTTGLVSIIITFANTVVLGMAYYGMSDVYSNRLTIANNIFSVFFILELV